MADVPNPDYQSEINLDEVVIKGQKTGSKQSAGTFTKIGGFLNGLFNGKTTVSKDASTPTTTQNTTTGMEPISAIVAGIGAASNGIFSWLGQKQSTKQEELKLQSLEKQKEVIEAQGSIEELKVLEAKIANQKQELINAQKTETGSNIVKVSIVGGVLLLAGFVVYQVFKTPKTPKVNDTPALPKPLPLK